MVEGGWEVERAGGVGGGGRLNELVVWVVEGGWGCVSVAFLRIS